MALFQEDGQSCVLKDDKTGKWKGKWKKKKKVVGK